MAKDHGAPTSKSSVVVVRNGDWRRMAPTLKVAATRSGAGTPTGQCHTAQVLIDLAHPVDLRCYVRGLLGGHMIAVEVNADFYRLAWP